MDLNTHTQNVSKLIADSYRTIINTRGELQQILFISNDIVDEFSRITIMNGKKLLKTIALIELNGSILTTVVDEEKVARKADTLPPEVHYEIVDLFGRHYGIQNLAKTLIKTASSQNTNYLGEALEKTEDIAMEHYSRAVRHLTYLFARENINNKNSNVLLLQHINVLFVKILNLAC